MPDTPLNFGRLTSPVTYAQLTGDNPTGTADMTAPDPIFSPGPSQSITAPDDISGMRQAVNQGPALQPAYLGGGGYIDASGKHKASIGRQIGSALLSLIAGPEAGREILTAPYQEDLKNWAASEAQRQKKISEAKDLAETAAKVGLQGAQATEAGQHGAFYQAQVNQAKFNPPTAEDAVTMTRMAHPEMTPDQEAAIRKMSPSGVADYLGKFATIAPLFGSKPDFQKVAQSVAAMGKFGLDPNDPTQIANFAAILESGGKNAGSELLKAITTEPKDEKPFEGGTVGALVSSEALRRGYKSAQDFKEKDPKGFNEYTAKAALIVPGTTATIRAEGFGAIREYPMLDTKNQNALQMLNANDINAANKNEPGRYIPAQQGTQALTRTALIEDIRGAIQRSRDALNNPKMPEFDASMRAKIAIAMTDRDPRSAVSALVSGQAGKILTPEQQDYLINSSQLVEQAMAMRSVLGAGQGSEQLRDAILRTIPGPTTPTKAYARKQLDAFEGTLNRLARGIPNVPLREGAGTSTGGGGAININRDANGRIIGIE